jgi:VWFA-related protein
MVRWIALQSGVLLAISWAWAGCPALAQSHVSDEAQTTLHATSTLVVVPALVQTQTRDLVFSLTADDFTLTDNDVPQKITLETDAARPLSLVVLMQTGGAARSQFASYANLETMLASILGSPPNVASIVNFDSRPEAASPFTSDIAQWREAIDHPDPGDSGAAIFDGLAYALDLLKKQPPNTRHVILLISQEHDDGSKTPLKEIVRAVGETNTAIYSFTFSAEKASIKEAFKGSTPPNKPVRVGDRQFVQYFDLGAPLKLALGAMRKNLSAEVANLSGGESSSFDNRVDLDQALGAMNNHLGNSYVLSFYPASSKPGLHTIRVSLSRHPELLVTARSSYWAAETQVDGASSNPNR